MGQQGLSEAKFIQMGMTKERWPYVTEELIRHFLDNPGELDGPDDYVECFFYYHAWYWRNNS